MIPVTEVPKIVKNHQNVSKEMTLLMRGFTWRLSENGYFPQSLRQAQIIILEILQCIHVVIILAFLDLGKNISFSDSLLVPYITDTTDC